MSSESMWAPTSSTPATGRKPNGGGSHAPQPSSRSGNHNVRGGGRGNRGGGGRGGNNNSGPRGGGFANGSSSVQIDALPTPAFNREVAPHLSAAQGGHGPSSHPVNLNTITAQGGSNSRRGSVGGSDGGGGHGHVQGNGNGNGRDRGGRSRAKEKEALWNSLWGEDADDGKAKAQEKVQVQVQAVVSPPPVAQGKTLAEQMATTPSPPSTAVGADHIQTSAPAAATTTRTIKVERATASKDAEENTDPFANRAGASASRWAPQPGDAPVSLAAPRVGRGGGRRGGDAGKKGGAAGSRNGGTGRDDLSAGMLNMSLQTEHLTPPHTVLDAARLSSSSTVPPPDSAITLTHEPVSSPPDLKTILSGTITTFASSVPNRAFVESTTPEPPVTPHKAVPLDRIDPSTPTNGTRTDWADEDDDEAALEAELEEMKAQWGMTEPSADVNGPGQEQDVQEDVETASAPPIDTPAQSPPTSPKRGLVTAPTASLPVRPPANLALKAIESMRGAPRNGDARSAPPPPPTGPRNGQVGGRGRIEPTELIPTEPAPAEVVERAHPVARLPPKERPKANVKNDAFLRMSGGMFGGGRGGGVGQRRGGRGRGGGTSGGVDAAAQK